MTDQAYAPPSIETLQALPLAASQDLAINALGVTCDQDVRLSHAAFRRCCARLAASLVARPLQRSSVVAIVVPNSPHFVAAFLAVTAVGCVAAPLNSKYTVDEFSFYLKDAAVSLVILPSQISEDAPIVAATTTLGIATQTLPPDLLDDIDDGIDYPSVATVAPTDVAMFLHTSGTTSRPKGVPLTHANLCASIRNISCTYELEPSDSSLLVMPLFHVHGLMSAALSTLATGGTVVFLPGGRFSASAFWPSAQRAQVTWFTAVPTIHQILLARASDEYPADDPPKLRFIRSCSASLAPAVLERLEVTFGAPVLEAYAMTEAAHQMTSNPLPKGGPRRLGSVGVPQNVQLCILDEQNQPLPTGSVGEVCIRGENVIAGYQNNTEADKTAFAGGWFHTGDQGKLDDAGYLMLTGRIKELVNRGGEKISPLEVDAVLLAHSAVTEAVSFAVPDEKYGEEVNAAVILKKGASGVDEEALMHFAKSKLASFKVPKKFFICDDLPRTATGKIQRRIVSKHFLSS